MSLITRLFGKSAGAAEERSRSRYLVGTDEVHVYNATWSIPESIGGMTTAALRRIRSFQKFGRPLSQTLLTFSPRMDVDEVRERLLAEGRVTEDLRLLNVWSDLRNRGDAELAEIRGEPSTDPVPNEDGEVERINEFYDVFRDQKTGAVIRRNYLRVNGRPLLVDVRDPKVGRRFILYSSSGDPIAEWRRPRDFYNAWVSSVVSEDPAVLIVDDKKVSEFIHEISDRRFGLILFLHGTHLRLPWNGALGEFLPRRLETMRNFDRFDVVGVQTRQQAAAIEARGISGDNVRLLTGELPSTAVNSDVPTDRSMNSAVMVANLIALKRIDHAIRTVSVLKERGVDVRLTVLGEGPERPALERLIEELGVADRVELPGYVHDVGARLETASFSLLTSTSEGLPLAMMESMGAGCVPIVYDITYGPGDLVVQGDNGYVTPFGDVDALADQIEEFLELDQDHVASMRSKAIETAAEYLPAVGYSRWKTVLCELERPWLPDIDSRRTGESIAPRSLTVSGTERGVELEMDLTVIDGSIAPLLQLVLSGRKVNSYFLCSEPKIRSHARGRGATVTFAVPHELFSESDGEIFDVFLRRPRDPWNAKRRVRTPSTFSPTVSDSREWYATKYGNLSVRPER